MEKLNRKMLMLYNFSLSLKEIIFIGSLMLDNIVYVTLRREQKKNVWNFKNSNVNVRL